MTNPINPLHTIIIMDMPLGFPSADYDQVGRYIDNTIRNNYGTIFRQCYDAWRAVAIRYKTCSEHSDNFRNAVNAVPVNRGPDNTEFFNQEKELFGFIFNGHSTIESLFYFLWYIGTAIPNLPQGSFTVNSPRNINPATTISNFSNLFAGDNLTRTLLNNFYNRTRTVPRQGLRQSPDYEVWSERRNYLAHRSAPPPAQTVSLPTINVASTYLPPRVYPNWDRQPEDPNEPLDRFIFDPNGTVNELTWLTDTLTAVFPEIVNFVRQHLP